MKYFFTTKVKVVLVVALLLSATLAVISSLTGLNPGDLFVKGVLTPLRTGISALTDEAEKLYKAADCCSLARVDFFVKEDGEVVFNEINTIPGFTNISMYPKIAEAAGIDHKTLITMLIENGAGTVR